jgi:hypothetical protein
MVLKPGNLGEQIRKEWKVLTCDDSGRWRRSDGPILCEMKYYKE